MARNSSRRSLSTPSKTDLDVGGLEEDIGGDQSASTSKQEGPKSTKIVSPVPPKEPEPALKQEHAKKRGWALALWYTKIGILLIIWGFFSVLLFITPEKDESQRLIVVRSNDIAEHRFILDAYVPKAIKVTLTGPFKNTIVPEPTEDRYWTEVYMEQNTRDMANIRTQKVTDSKLAEMFAPDIITRRGASTTVLHFTITNLDRTLPTHDFALRLKTNINEDVALKLTFDPRPVDQNLGLIAGLVVLAFLYTAIVTEIINRTVASLIASTFALGILSVFDSRPSTSKIMSWIDIETMMLLIGMMILVAVFSDSGIFDYLAVLAFQWTSGKIWPLINTLCLFVGFLSAFLDNVTMMLLMTPITIRLCEVKSINPVPLMLCMVIFSNIGAAVTPVGDPPNVIICSNKIVKATGVNFGSFVMHLLPGAVLAAAITYGFIRLYYRNPNSFEFKESKTVQALRHEIHGWQRVAGGITPYSKDEETVRETLLVKIDQLKAQLETELNTQPKIAEADFDETLKRLKVEYPIRNKTLLIKAIVAMSFVLILFVLHSVEHLHFLSLGWTAMIGALLLLAIVDLRDMEAILVRIEWSTLIFFSALFILMEALTELGVISVLGRLVVRSIRSVSAEWRLTLAIAIILWVSSIASAFLNNIPVTTMMIKILEQLHSDKELNLPFQPLVWALVFGACLGGNGTIIGASANVVSAGVIEQHGYKITFMDFFKIGFPVAMLTTLVSMGYLLFCHVLLPWH